LDGFWGGKGIEVTSLWLGVFTFQVLLFGFSFTNSLLDGFVGLLAGNDLSLASGWLDVRDRDMKLLLDDSSVDLTITITY